MRRILQTFLIGFLMAFHAVASANSPALGTGETRAFKIKKVIRAQLTAFNRNDAATAYRQAAPLIRARYRSATHFMMMVKHNFQPVYRSRAFQFGRLGRVHGRPVQEVIIVDANQRLWRALYSMERQTSGGWKIFGVLLIPLEGQSA